MVSNYKISKDLKRYKKDLKGTCDLRREFKKQFELFMAAVRHQMTDGQTDTQLKCPPMDPSPTLDLFYNTNFRIRDIDSDMI